MNKSEWASWAQAVGSFIAIALAWCQGFKMASAERKLRRNSEERRRNLLLNQSISLINELIIICNSIKDKHERFLGERNARFDIGEMRKSSGYVGVPDEHRTAINPDWNSYKNDFESIIERLLSFPYWDLDDLEAEAELNSVILQTKECQLKIGGDVKRFQILLNKLIIKLDISREILLSRNHKK